MNEKNECRITPACISIVFSLIYILIVTAPCVRSSCCLRHAIRALCKKSMILQGGGVFFFSGKLYNGKQLKTHEPTEEACVYRHFSIRGYVMKKRMWISGFLAFFLCLSSLPVQAYTLEEDSESLLYSDLRPAAKSWGGGLHFRMKAPM